VCVSGRNVLKSYMHGDGKHEIDLLWPNHIILYGVMVMTVVVNC
jgi:hypothetical protein